MITRVYPGQTGIIRQIIQLEAAAFGEGGLDEWDLMPLIRHGRVFCMEENGQVLGCVQYMKDWDDPSKSYIIGLSIADGLRGKGYGTELLATSMDMLAGEGMKTFELTVDPDNAAGIAVYVRKLGFEITGRRPDEYGEGIHRIIMEKTM